MANSTAFDDVFLWRFGGREYLVHGVESRESLPDFNDDGGVDLVDWFMMRASHFGAAVANIASWIVVPEPSSYLVALGLGWPILPWRFVGPRLQSAGESLSWRILSWR